MIDDEGTIYEDTTLYRVVVNNQGQYSIWPEARKPRLEGWTDVDKTGTKAECLAYINEVWTDRRPKSESGSPYTAY